MMDTQKAVVQEETFTQITSSIHQARTRLDQAGALLNRLGKQLDRAAVLNDSARRALHARNQKPF